MRKFYAPMGTHQVGKFPRYKPKYTRFLANFRISGVKNCWGQTHPKLASVGHPLPTVKFLGAKPLNPKIWASEKVERVETTVLFFALCGPKFTKFDRRIWEWPSLQRRFPMDDILFPSGDIRDQVAKSKIWPKFWCFWDAKFFLGRNPQISDSIL